MPKETCIACKGWGKVETGYRANWAQVALLPLATLDFGQSRLPAISHVLIHPACMVDYLAANPHLAITSRAEFAVAAEETRETSRATMATIDDERGYPGVESLGVPQLEKWLHQNYPQARRR